jgi:hypothetical protein
MNVPNNKLMDKYYSPEICVDRITDLFQPIITYWTNYDLHLQSENPVHGADPRVQQLLRNQAKQNHDDMLHYLVRLPIDGDKYTLLLIYEKVYFEMHQYVPDTKYDCYYLCNKFMECLEKVLNKE